MTDTRFTPGPWQKMHDHPNPETRVSLATIRGPIDKYGIRDEIASVYCCDYRDRKQEFNAHLIAAAPELYEALEELQNIVSGLLSGEMGLKDIDSFTNQPARAALAKARGEQS